MYLLSFLALLAGAGPHLATVTARPTTENPALSRSVHIFSDAMLLDSAGYNTGQSGTSRSANFRVYKFIRQPDGEIGRIMDSTILPEVLKLVPGLHIVGGSLTTL